MLSSNRARAYTQERPSRGTDKVVHVLVVSGVMAALGMLVMVDASVSRGAQGTLLFPAKQIVATVVGIVATWILVGQGPTRVRAMAVPLFYVVLALNVLVTFIGKEVNGARLWFDLGYIMLQPSEFAKVALILFLAVTLSGSRDQTRSSAEVAHGLWPAHALLGFGALLLSVGVLQRDLGNASVLCVIGLVVLLMAGVAQHVLVTVSALLAAGGLGMGLMSSHIRARLEAWFDPFTHRMGVGQQIAESLSSMGRATIWGAGYTNGRAKLNIGAANTDYVFVTLAEEFGLFGTMAMVLCAAAMLVTFMLAAREAKTYAGVLLAGGVLAWYGSQTAMNLAMATNMLPSIGVTLPFVSYGGSAQIAACLAVGLVLLAIMDRPQERSRPRPGQRSRRIV